MFDLNRALEQWRDGLQRRALRQSDVQELEDHLHDEMENLATAPLTEEERFLVAARRLGDSASLAGEFAKIHPADRWRGRVFWMAAGLLGWILLSAVGNLASEAAMLGALMAGLSEPFRLGVLGWGVKLAAMVLALSFLLAAAQPNGSAIRLGREIGRLWRRSRAWRTLLAAAGGLAMALLIVGTWFAPVLHSRFMSVEVLGRMALINLAGNLLFALLLPLLLAVIVIQLRPSRHAAGFERFT